ncbi:MAG TPA: beta-propeller fold lactonase family protein [Burkholderiaceae bacterium]
MKYPHSATRSLSTTLLPLTLGLGLGLALAGCGGGSGDSHQQGMARQIRPAQKTSSVNAQYATLVQQLYVSFFGRPADPTGLANFEAALAAANAPSDAQSLLQIYNSKTNPAVNALVDSFGTSAESQALYGNGTTDQFVQAIFSNVLNRQPLQSGLDFWANAIDSGSMTRGSASLQIMVGALTNTSAQGQLDQQLISNRLSVAATFTADIQTAPELRGYKGAAAAQIARSLLSAVTATTNLSSYASTVNATVVSLQRFLIGGSLAGLASGESLGLLNNGGDALALTANGAFDFASPLLGGASFDVTVSTQPVGELCSVTNGSGQVISDVSSVGISCHFPYAYAINLTGNSISQYALQATGALSIDAAASVPTGKTPSSIVVGPGYKSVYVTNQGDNTVGQFTINADGSLTPGGAVQAQSEPTALAITPNGKFAYVANFGTTTVSQYSVTGSGSLAALGTATVTTGTAPTAVAVDPTSSYVYVVNNVSQTVAQFTVGSNGALSPMSTPTVGTGGSPLAIGMSPNGRYVYVINNGVGDHSVSQYAVGSNGSLTPLSPAKIGIGTSPSSIAFDPAGKNAYVVDTSGVVWQLAIGSGGTLSQAGSTNVAGLTGLAIDPSGRFAYATVSSGAVAQFAVGGSGGLSALSPASVTAGQGAYGIAVNF